MADGMSIDGITIDRLDTSSETDAYKFVMSSWKHSYREAYERIVTHRRMTESERAAYFQRENLAMAAALREHTVLLARTTADPDAFVGWSCGTPGVLQYVYVKRGPWRRCGIASRLVEQVAGKRGGVYRYGSLHNKAIDAFERRGWRYEATTPEL